MKRGSEFYRLFFLREFWPLAGKRIHNLVILIIMLSVVFTILGFAEGSLIYLEKKMKDPFINWVTIYPKSYEGASAMRMINELNNDLVLDEYNLKSAQGFNMMFLNFYNYNDILDFYKSGVINNERLYPFSARTMDLQDPLIQEIMSSRNHITGTGFTDDLDIGLIVTDDMLSRLNYPVDAPYIWTDFLVSRNAENVDIRVPLPLPVRAVVHSLPGRSAWAATSFFYQQRNYYFADNPFNPLRDNRLVLAYYGDELEVSQLVNDLSNILGIDGLFSGLSVSSVFNEPRYLNDQIDHYLIFIHFESSNPTGDALNEMFLELYNHSDVAVYRKNLYRLFDYETRFKTLNETYGYDRVSLNFSRLDKLREFGVLLKEKYDLEIDMAQIESKENYTYVSRLTHVLSIVLILFGIICVLLFVGFLLQQHLESIKRNLGTFKAFGLSEGILKSIYVDIVIVLVLAAMIVSLFLSSVFGYMGGMRLVLILTGSDMEKGTYFSLTSFSFLMTVFTLLVFSVVVIRAVVDRILKSTPGDLIYERN